MYSFFKGLVIENHLEYIILETQGVGYKIFVPPNSALLNPGQNALVYTTFVLREHSQALYGFTSQRSRDLFELLITLSGVGPKTAMCVLSKFSPEQLQQAIEDHNTDLIATVPGIGRKTAQRLMLELRNRLPKIATIQQNVMEGAFDQKAKDAAQALVNLGFSHLQARKAIEQVLSKNAEEKEMELSTLITEALRLA